MSWKPLEVRLRQRFKAMTGRDYVVLAAIIVAIAVLITVLMLRPGPDPLESAELSHIYSRGALRVGVRSDIPGFGTKDSAGDPAGLEPDLARLLAEKIFGTAEVEFVEVNFNTLSAMLRRGELDCAIALAQKDLSTALSYSESYFEDAAAVMVKAESDITVPSQLAGKVIGCINRDGSNNRYAVRNAIKSYAASLEPAATVKEYASSADLFYDLAQGRIDAACMEYALLISYYSEAGHRILPQAIGTISYAIALPKGSEALKEIADGMISDMRKDGSLAALIEKWNLADYSGR